MYFTNFLFTFFKFHFYFGKGVFPLVVVLFSTNFFNKCVASVKITWVLFGGIDCWQWVFSFQYVSHLADYISAFNMFLILSTTHFCKPTEFLNILQMWGTTKRFPKCHIYSKVLKFSPVASWKIVFVLVLQVTSTQVKVFIDRFFIFILFALSAYTASVDLSYLFFISTSSL